MLNALLMFFGAKIAERLHMRVVLGVIGITGPIVVFFSSYAPSYAVYWVMYLYSFAVINAMTYMTPIHHTWLWFPNNIGLASGLCVSGYAISGLIFNNLSLYLVNPDHISANPDGSYDEVVYKNVPYMLRVLGCVWAGLVIISVMLVHPGPEPDERV
jgi:hypothetical protein